MGLTKDQARRLADQILKTPNKTAYLKGNLEDLQRKLADAKDRLKKVPDSRKAQVRADIRDLEAKIRKAKSDIASVRGKTVTITTKYVVVGDGSAARKRGSEGSQLKNAKGGLIRGPGTGTSDSIVSRVSNGEFVVRASSVSKYGVDTLRAINEGRFDKAAQVSGKAAVATTVGRPAGGSSVVQQVNVRIDVSGATDPVAVAKAIQKQLLELKRVSGVNINLGVG
jgi:seryl-tRNA synthetase